MPIYQCGSGRFTHTRHEARIAAAISGEIVVPFVGVWDTVLTQTRFLFNRRNTEAHGLVHSIWQYARP